MQLNRQFRYALYAALAVLFLTGAIWLVADQLKETPDADAWQSVAANMLMLHGGGAMMTLLLLGALFPLHIRPSWRSGRNRITGTLMLTAATLLIATGFGLYYFGSETLRPLSSVIHTVIGFALPALGLIHILTGRRSRPRESDRGGRLV